VVLVALLCGRLSSESDDFKRRILFSGLHIPIR
jgi:hypothetical protein